VERAQRAIEEGSQSFASASKLFDRTTRERAWLLYAWCRRCDDIADNQDKGGPLGEQGDLRDAENRLQAIRALTKHAFDEQPTADPAFDGFGLVADECGLPMNLANDMIAGFALDAAGWAPANEADMLRYCYHVAGSVGVMMALVMGVLSDDGKTLDRACDLGLAFQLANIARDVVEDASGGRCYLPASWLDDAGLSAGTHALPENRPALAGLMPRLVALMEKHEAASKLGTTSLRFRQRWAVLAAARIYGAIGRKVLARGANAWDSRTRVGRREKLWHVATAFLAALVNRPNPPAEPITWTRHDFRPVAGW
jgi:phytoene synthase